MFNFCEQSPTGFEVGKTYGFENPKWTRGWPMNEKHNEDLSFRAIFVQGTCVRRIQDNVYLFHGQPDKVENPESRHWIGKDCFFYARYTEYEGCRIIRPRSPNPPTDSGLHLLS